MYKVKERVIGNTIVTIYQTENIYRIYIHNGNMVEGIETKTFDRAFEIYLQEIGYALERNGKNNVRY